MLFSNLYAKLQEDEEKTSPVDGRGFNKRSRIKMNREAQTIIRSINKNSKKRKNGEGLKRGVFSEEDIEQGREAKKKFMEESIKKRSRSEGSLGEETEKAGSDTGFTTGNLELRITPSHGVEDFDGKNNGINLTKYFLPFFLALIKQINNI